MKICLVFSCLFAIVIASALPPELAPCPKGDADCCSSTIKTLLLFILSQLGDPLPLPELVVPPGPGILQLNKKLTNVEIAGLAALELKDYVFDLNQGKISLMLYGAALTITADYDINGRALLLPIYGSGCATYQLANVDLQLDVSVTLDPAAGALKVTCLKIIAQIESVALDFSSFYGETDVKILTPIVGQILNLDNKLVLYEEVPAYISVLEPALTLLVTPIVESLDPTLLLSLLL